MKRSVIIGASAGLGRALAERLAALGHNLFLVASDQRDLAPLAGDLTIRFGVDVTVLAADLYRVDAGLIRERALSALGGVDHLLLIAGFSAPAIDRGAITPEMVDRMITINLSAMIQVVNAFLPELANAQGGNLVGAGSVAAVRGRRSNMVYGAAKRGLEGYFESCRHWLANKAGARVQFYRLGYLETQMVFGQKLPFPALHPDAAAAAIVAHFGQDTGTRYLPRWWWLVMTLIRLIPWVIFKRLEI